MITLLLITLILIFSIAILIIGVHGFTEKLNAPDELATRLRPINIEAFRNLLDPVQDAYLAKHVTGRDLRSVRRERAMIAFEYVSRIAVNAALVMQAAELARRSTVPEIAGAGARIANIAVQTRVLAVRALISIALSVIFPGRPLGAPILQQYCDLDVDISLFAATVSHAPGKGTV